MHDVPQKKIIVFSLDALSALSFFSAVICLFLRLNTLLPKAAENLNLFAAKSIFFRNPFEGKKLFKTGGVNPLQINDICKNDAHNKITPSKAETANPDIDLSRAEIPKEEQSHGENEKTFKIIENQFKSGGTKCENFYIKNSTGQNLNFEEYLRKTPEIRITDTPAPQVLILHTHTSESYMLEDLGYFYESFYPRSLDDSKNVTRVGEMIVKTLSANGINAIHTTLYHDNPTYNGSYARAAKTIQQILSENPSIQVVIDIHRDSLGSKETGKIKPTFKYKDKKAAQIMIISGCDHNNNLGFPGWQKNLVLALKLQKYCENLFPGITRPLNFSNVKYNEHLTPGSLLIEVGSEVNTLQEAVYTGSMIGESLSKLLKDLKK